MRRIMGRELPGAPHEVLLVLDATTGQNAIAQARMFKDEIGVTGLILTKLDGTAKGGVVVRIAKELNIPLRYIGVGEQVDDLRPFRAEEFVEALFAPERPLNRPAAETRMRKMNRPIAGQRESLPRNRQRCGSRIDFPTWTRLARQAGLQSGNPRHDQTDTRHRRHPRLQPRAEAAPRPDPARPAHRHHRLHRRLPRPRPRRPEGSSIPSSI